MNNTPRADIITILKITQTSENFLKLEYISPEQGLAFGLLRQSKRNNNSNHADLFDTAEIFYTSSSNSEYKFLKSYNPIQKRSAIGSNYKHLRYACYFATFLIDNVSDLPDPSDLNCLTVKTFDAFEQRYCSEIIILKAIYRFIKTEGFPIDNVWWQSLTKENKSIAKQLLTTPLNEINANSDINSVSSIFRLLCKWIREETELKIRAI